jgi:hypothetical protein
MKEALGVPRLALRVWEAADSYGVSVDWFEEHVLPHVRWYREGRMKLIPVAELVRYLDERSRRPEDLVRTP